MWTKSTITMKAKPNILELSIEFDHASYDNEEWRAFCARVAGGEFEANIMTMFYPDPITGENTTGVSIFCDNDNLSIEPEWLEGFDK